MVDPVVPLPSNKESNEDVAVANWCENINVSHLVENEEIERSKSSSTDKLLGESIHPPSLPSPHHSSPMEEPPPPLLHLEPSVEVDCRVSTGQDCSVTSSQGTSPLSVSHHALVQLVTKAYGAWIVLVLWYGSLARLLTSRLDTNVFGA